MFHAFSRAAIAAAVLGCTAATAQPVPLKDLPLIDHRAQALAPALRQRPTLLHFVYTTCSTACPVVVHELAQLHRDLPDDVRRAVRFVSVTVDPLQDTPDSLAAYARRLGADRPGWHFVTGPGAHTLAERLAVFAPERSALADHRTSLYLYDARGALLQRYGAMPVDRARLVAELQQVARQR